MLQIFHLHLFRSILLNSLFFHGFIIPQFNKNYLKNYLFYQKKTPSSNSVLVTLLTRFLNNSSSDSERIMMSHGIWFYFSIWKIKRMQNSTYDSFYSSRVSRQHLCFFRLTRYPWIASWIFFKASLLVFPCEIQPGNEGHSTTNTPSSSCEIKTLYIKYSLSNWWISYKKDFIPECF